MATWLTPNQRVVLRHLAEKGALPAGPFSRDEVMEGLGANRYTVIQFEDKGLAVLDGDRLVATPLALEVLEVLNAGSVAAYRAERARRRRVEDERSARAAKLAAVRAVVGERRDARAARWAEWERRLAAGETMAQIGATHGISRQAVSASLKFARRQVRAAG